jgi:hypothetical protein
MSSGGACKCRPRDVDVIMRNGNRSAFSGYHWTPSAYSAVRCLKCGAIWRTKAAYVRQAPDAPNDWSKEAGP